MTSLVGNVFLQGCHKLLVSFVKFMLYFCNCMIPWFVKQTMSFWIIHSHLVVLLCFSWVDLFVCWAGGIITFAMSLNSITSDGKCSSTPHIVFHEILSWLSFKSNSEILFFKGVQFVIFLFRWSVDNLLPVKGDSLSDGVCCSVWFIVVCWDGVCRYEL